MVRTSWKSQSMTVVSPDQKTGAMCFSSANNKESLPVNLSRYKFQRLPAHPLFCCSLLLDADFERLSAVGC